VRALAAVPGCCAMAAEHKFGVEATLLIPRGSIPFVK